MDAHSHKDVDYAANAALVSSLIRERQKPYQDNSTQEKHLERGRIALAVHQGEPYFG